MMVTAILVGLELRFSEDERDRLVGEAARLGYDGAWTTSGPDLSGVEACRRWFDATGLATGTAVVPTPTVDLAALARAARALGEASGGRFILGIGAGGMSSPAWRAEHGLADARPLAMMRDHVRRLKGEAGVPVFLAAVGPRMLELAGEIADGALPLWMDPSQLAWARERIAEGARRVGRDPATIRIGQSVRVSVDEDAEAARRAVARQALRYSLGRPSGVVVGPYRQMMSRMGLDEDLTMLEGMRDRGAGEEELAEAFPERALRRLGAWGTPEQATARLRELAAPLDIALVRVVAARPGLDAARAVIQACAPGRPS
jgi:5,10-methylenetetrahydromethanopterin reductase